MHYKVVANKTYNRIFCSLSTTGEYKKPLGLSVPGKMNQMIQIIK